MKSTHFAAVCLALASSSFALERQDRAPAPAAKPAAEKQKPTVYDESADGATQIAVALAKAKFAHKRVLVQWGANWCGWCIKLHGLYRSDKDIAHELLYEYEPVFVDIGRFDKQLELGAKYQADIKAHGVPYLTVLDEDGKLVTNQDSGELEIPKGDAHDPAKVLGFLKTNQAAPAKADELLAAALQRATREEKRVFVHFSTPWCHWCRALEAWMAQPEVALMIDAERYAGAPEMLKRYTDKQPGWPWIVLLDGEGHALADSYDGKGENIGFPSADAEIAHLASMFEKARTHFAPADLETLRKSLVETREKAEKAAKQAQQAAKQAAPASAGH
jgi:thiol-disulfide isomerase/thioredoxin